MWCPSYLLSPHITSERQGDAVPFSLLGPAQTFGPSTCNSCARALSLTLVGVAAAATAAAAHRPRGLLLLAKQDWAPRPALPAHCSPASATEAQRLEGELIATSSSNRKAKACRLPPRLLRLFDYGWTRMQILLIRRNKEARQVPSVWFRPATATAPLGCTPCPVSRAPPTPFAAPDRHGAQHQGCLLCHRPDPVWHLHLSRR